MKKCAALLSLCFGLLASAKEDTSYWSFHPLHVGANAIRIGRASVTDGASGDLYFRKTSVFSDLLVPVSETSYFFPRVEWNMFSLDWNKNTKFTQNHFHYLQFALTFYSIGLEDWRWIVRADYNLDVNHFSDPGRYGLFSGLLWGAYQPHRKWHFHMGALGYVGMEGDQIWPVIGADFAPNKKWFFQLLFPMNYSVEYNISSKWRLSAKVRPLKERFRTGAKEPQPRSVFSYSTTGAEINAHYELPRRLEIEMYAGYNLGGSFYIKNQFGKNGLWTDLGGAPYVGASLNVGF